MILDTCYWNLAVNRKLSLNRESTFLELVHLYTVQMTLAYLIFDVQYLICSLCRRSGKELITQDFITASGIQTRFLDDAVKSVDLKHLP